jgi:ComF family protein
MLEKVLDLVFPPCCVLCGKLAKDWICTECEKELSSLLNPIIIKKSKYDLGYLFKYDGVIRKLMIEFKFFESPFISHFFVSEILKSEKIIGKLLFYDIIIPVGMSRSKQKDRGYNQTYVISKLLAFELNKRIKENFYLNWQNNTCLKRIKCYNILHKKEGIKQQAKLTKKERMQNVKGAYYITDCDKQLIKNKNIVLLDDIYTTGATVNECVNVLQKSGVNKIFVLTVARDIYNN